MMFSSRRSRNRHSANPNAKLHIDLQRRGSAVRPSTSFHQLSTSLAGPFKAGTSVVDESRLKGSRRYVGGGTESCDGRPAPSWTECRHQMFTWCHDDDDDDATDSFQHLTKLAEMTGNMVEAASSQHLTTPACPAARRRKSALPTRCESQQEDWSSADSDVEFDERLNRESCSDQGEPMTTEYQETAGPLDCVVRRPDQLDAARPVDSSPNSAISPSRTFMHDERPRSTCDHSELNYRLNEEQHDEQERNVEMKDNGVQHDGLDSVQLCDTEEKPRRESVSPESSDSDEDEELVHHPCTVAGCQAAFRSRRSRDRHSGNVLLHHRLLSTAQQHHAPASGTSTSSEPAPLMTSSWLGTAGEAAAAACYYLMQLRYAGHNSYLDVGLHRVICSK